MTLQDITLIDSLTDRNEWIIKQHVVAISCNFTACSFESYTVVHEKICIIHYQVLEKYINCNARENEDKRLICIISPCNVYM